MKPPKLSAIGLILIGLTVGWMLFNPNTPVKQASESIGDFASPQLALAEDAAPAAIADGPPQHRHIDSDEAAASAEDSAFHSEINAAMDKMMAGMAVTPTGDIDRDFVEMMVPHHQGAIDMALAVLRFGKNEKIRRLAQEIIVTQQQEIAVMRLAIGDPLPESLASPTQRPSASPDATRSNDSTK